jgi:multidrug resistance protein
MATTSGVTPDLPQDHNPWPALWAMVIGFFMILVDNTIVSVATPAIRDDLDTDYNSVIWVTSAYLLAYAVPLLVTGRLGDRFGPKNMYLLGLTIFTLASLWCGLTGSIEMLIVARVVQGFGAALITPQTMAVITRTFPAAKRGGAMALWGATAGVAMLVGPILGGVLVDSLGWEWIFIINVPVGIIGFVLAFRLVPTLPTHTHSFDWLGVALSGIGVFLVVFGVQEGEKYDWGQITGIISVPLLIVAGLVVFAVFVWWQGRIKKEPLVPLGLFRDRNFSLGNGGIALVSLAITSMSLPFFFYAQGVRGWSPTESALLMAPMAIVLMALSPVVGAAAPHVAVRRLQRLPLGTAERHGDPQPADGIGGLRCRRLQHDASDRRRARQRGRRRAHPGSSDSQRPRGRDGGRPVVRLDARPRADGIRRCHVGDALSAGRRLPHRARAGPVLCQAHSRRPRTGRGRGPGRQVGAYDVATDEGARPSPRVGGCLRRSS